jgi:glycosyltransferase involved in cell wall biosynthesis
VKIVLFSFLFEPELGGGAAVVVNQLVRALVAHSYDVVVVTTWDGKKIETEYLDGIKLIRIPAYNLYWVAEKDKQPTWKKILWQLLDVWNPLVYHVVRQILLDEAPDIVHSHKLRGLSPSIWRAAQAVGVEKIVHTCHDYELLSPEGFFMGWAGRLAERQHLLMRPYQFLRRHFSKAIHIVTAPSQFVLDYHEKMGYFPLAAKKVVPNSHGVRSVELNARETKSLSKADAGIRFLFLGRLEAAKGVDLLCEAFLQFAADNMDFVLYITGWGMLADELRAKYAHQNNIIFTGALFGVEKDELIRKSDFLIAPSVFSEPFGIVIVEAYAQGTPVITSRAGAFPETVSEGQTGFLVSTGSVGELRTILERVSTDFFDWKEMSENCLQEAQNYTFEKMIAEYLAVYEYDGN